MNRDDLPAIDESLREEAAAAVEANLVAMKDLLVQLRPQSTADALMLLRRAFPDLPLGERVRAASRFGRRV